MFDAGNEDVAKPMHEFEVWVSSGTSVIVAGTYNDREAAERKFLMEWQKRQHKPRSERPLIGLFNAIERRLIKSDV